MNSLLKSDISRYNFKNRNWLKAWLTGHTIMVCLNYRLANWLYRHHIKFIPDFIKFRVQRRYCCEISPCATIGGGLFIPHSIGIVIGHSVVIGENFEVFQNVTVGSNRKEKNGKMMPRIGNNVSIGTGAVVVGGITIGNNVKIGANSYVDFDVPDNVFVAGIPGKIIRKI